MSRAKKNSAVMFAAWNYNIGPITGLFATKRSHLMQMLAADGRTMEHHTIRKVLVTWEEDHTPKKANQ